MKSLVDVVQGMKHSVIHNYIAPGLDSWLLGHAEGKGSIRMFENTRPQEFFISPHNHRFDFSCMVIRGSVTNTIYAPSDQGWEYGVSSYLKDQQCLGTYYEVKKFKRTATSYLAGQWYHMKQKEFHTIQFSPDALVLFLEGPFITENSEALQPMINGKLIDTFKVEKWMYHD